MNIRIKFGITLVLSLVASGVLSGEFSLNGGLSAEAVVQNVEDKTNDTTIDSNNLILRPFINIVYDSRDLELVATATHNHIRRSLEDVSVTNNFTNFNYSGNYQVIDNLLFFTVAGAQSYRSRAANSLLVDNFLLNSENLSKNNTNRASLNFNLPTGNYIGINASAGLSRTSSDAPRNPNAGGVELQSFSGNSYNGSLQIESGRDLLPVTYQFSGSIRGFNREQRRDFEGRRGNLRLGTNLSSDVNLRLLASYEANDIKNDRAEELSAQVLREFYSYGVGVAWQPSSNRFIEVGLNRSVTKGPLGLEDEEDDFVSVDLQWGFSSRTSIRGNYSRRFFGESGTLGIRHNLRNWRSSINYNETVTSNSRLVFNQEEGLLVCTNGSTNIADCSLSEGLDQSELEPNQILVPFVENSFELNDRIILRKSTIVQTAVDLRRTTISLSVTESSNEGLEQARDVNTSLARLAASLALSPRSNVTSTVTYSDIERVVDGNLQASIIRQFRISYNRDISRRFSASIAYSYLDRSGDSIGGSGGGGLRGINGPLTDNRIIAELRYNFGSR